MTVEFLSYADLCGFIRLADTRSRADRIGYVLSEVLGRSIFEFLSFSVVTALWFTTEAEARYVSTNERNLVVDSLPRVLLIWCALLVATSITQAWDLYDQVDDEDCCHGSTLVFRGHTVVEGISWGIHALLAIVCINMTSKRIMNLSTFPQTVLRLRLRIMIQTLLPMAICSVCYAIRAVWLMAQLTQSSPTVTASRKHMAWWFWFVWFPTLVPTVTLLYSARKRDPRVHDSESGNAVPLLVSTDPVPPAEAFVSFRRFAEDADLLSPLVAMRISDDSVDGGSEGGLLEETTTAAEEDDEEEQTTEEA